MPWPKIDTSHAHFAKALPDKGRTIKGLVYNEWDLEPFEQAKRSGPRLLSTLP